MATLHTFLLASLCVAAYAGYRGEGHQDDGNNDLYAFDMGEMLRNPDPSMEEALPTLYVDLLPPKNDPGDVIRKTDHSSVDSALTQTMKHLPVMADRACAVGVANLGPETLSNPKWYIASGLIFAAAPPEIKAGYTALNLFHKKPWEVRGSVGVLTYDIDNTDHKVAIMFHVPYDWNIYKVLFNMKVYPKSHPTDRSMYDQMLDYAGPYRPAGWEKRVERGVELTATMTESTKAKLYISIETSGYDANLPTELYHACDYNAGWARHYCWRECAQGKYCWVDQRCSNDSDCQNKGVLPCYNNSC